MICRGFDRDMTNDYSFEMDQEQDDSCPICAYKFSTPDRVPKILRCYHTICCPCIDNIIASTPSNPDSSVKCPICRQDFVIPRNGVNGFFTNYFKSAPHQEETCDVCGALDIRKLKLCSECNSTLCSACHNSHHHQDKKKHCDIDEDSDEETNGRDLRLLGNTFRSSVKSAFFGSLSTSFKCNNFERIRKIIPDDKNECWVLTNRPFVTKFSRSGKEMYRKYVENVLQDIAQFSDGTLVLAFSSGEILLLNGEELRQAINTESVPTSLYTYEDGRLLIAIQPHSGNTHMNNSGLIMTDQMMKKIQPLDVNVDLREVPSITVNEKTGQIALCETSKKCVFFVETSKTFKYPRIKKYTGQGGLKRLEQTEDRINITSSNHFHPRSIARDQNDNIFVLDAGTNLIHVLDEEASLQSIVLANLSGSISCFNVDTHENLWIGDVSGQIRVFRLEFHNFLGPEENSHGAIEGFSSHLSDSTTRVSLEDLRRLGLMRVTRSSVGELELPGLDLGGGLEGLLRSQSASNREDVSRIRDNFIRNVF